MSINNLPEKSITISRHIEDLNDLRNNRNCGINHNFSNDAIKIANEIIKPSSLNGCNTILFFSSPKIRALETVQLVTNYIENVSDLKTHVVIDPGIREIDQGEFLLPDNYYIGMDIPELHMAWEIFWHETFTKNNYVYKFGSVNSGSDINLYKDLGNFFESPGENYAQYFLRLLKSIEGLAKESTLLQNNSIKLSVVTHSAPLAIFRELEIIGKDILSGRKNISKGGLMKACWDAYRVRAIQKDPSCSHVDNFEINLLSHKLVLDRLSEEIVFLENVVKEDL